MSSDKSVPPHVGNMLNRHVRMNRYYQAALARDIGVRPETVVLHRSTSLHM